MVITLKGRKKKTDVYMHRKERKTLTSIKQERIKDNEIKFIFIMNYCHNGIINFC